MKSDIRRARPQEPAIFGKLRIPVIGNSDFKYFNGKCLFSVYQFLNGKLK